MKAMINGTRKTRRGRGGERHTNTERNRQTEIDRWRQRETDRQR